MSRPLGCLTFTALFTAALASIAILGVAAVTGNGVFSPGALSAIAQGEALGGVASHAELGARCASCHPAALSGQRMSDLCLVCHTTVKTEIATGGGLHGRFAGTESCRDCHTDHRGPAAALTLADPHVFPHERTGYVLTAHRLSSQGGSFGCKDCHPASPLSFTAPTCAGCHQTLDAPYMARHEATFGTTCLACHDGVDTYGAAFTHETYPLTGGHAQVQCAGCHQNATTPAALRATSTTCIGCHKANDVHNGSFGTDCASCHSTSTWTDATFDHDKAAFKLTGSHRSVTCQKCHVGGLYKGTPKTCAACHTKPASHTSAFAGNCASCHTTKAWIPASFNGPHPFPMDHGGAGGRCATCHPSTLTSYTCTKCHGQADMTDRHRGISGFSMSACVRCHPRGQGGD